MHRIGEVRFVDDNDFASFKSMCEIHDGWKLVYNKNGIVVRTKENDVSDFSMFKVCMSCNGNCWILNRQSSERWSKLTQQLYECWNIRSQDYSFPGTSFPGPFVPWNFRSEEYSFPGTFISWTIRSRDASNIRCYAENSFP